MRGLLQVGEVAGGVRAALPPVRGFRALPDEGAEVGGAGDPGGRDDREGAAAGHEVLRAGGEGGDQREPVPHGGEVGG